LLLSNVDYQIQNYANNKLKSIFSEIITRVRTHRIYLQAYYLTGILGKFLPLKL
jgi:hypothetical protein